MSESKRLEDYDLSVKTIGILESSMDSLSQENKKLKQQLRMFCDFLETGQITAANVLAAKVRSEL